MLIASIVVGGIYLHQKAVKTAYNNAITMIQAGSYGNGLGELEKINSKIKRSDFLQDMKYKKISTSYKDTLYLYAYALAQLNYNESRSLPTVNNYLGLIPKGYSGELHEEIKTFRENFKSEYDVYLAEEARKKVEHERAQRLSYKDKIPYEGMSETYISDTAMGHYHDYESKLVGKGTHHQNIWHKYYWKTDAGKIILIVECVDEKVISVAKYYDTTQWTSDGKPIFKQKGSSSSSTSTSRKKKTYNDDKYDVKDYYAAEDFYYDHYDDFYDYEEAEDYYNEHGDW